MENKNMVRELADMGNFEENSMKFLSMYILIIGVSLSLVLFSLMGFVVGIGAGLNTFVFSAASWIIGSVMIVDKE